MARAIGSDSRLVAKFIKAGPGFDGSCFQKGILNLIYLCGHYGLHEVAVVAAGGEPQHLATAPHLPPGGDQADWHRHRQAFGGAWLCLWPPADCVYKADTNDTPRSRMLLRRSIPSDPHLPQFAGGRGRAGDRRPQGFCGANYERRWPGA